MLGILNSKISRFYLSNLCDYVRGGYIRLKISYVEQLPIFVGNPIIRKAIEEIVSKIITFKKTNADANIKEFEAEIDQLVYELYGLTEEEIRIVERS